MNNSSKLFILILSTSIISFSSFSQNNKIDSLEKQLKIVSEKDKPKILSELSELWFKDSFLLSIMYAKQRINISDNFEDSARALIQVGRIYYNKSYFDTALVYFNTAKKIAIHSKHVKLTADSYKNIGRTYLLTNNYEKALKNYLSALVLYIQLDDTEGIGDMYNNIGLINLYMNKNQTAINYFFRALQKGKELEDIEKISYVLNNIGLAYAQDNCLDSAVFYYKKSLILKKGKGKMSNLPSTLNNIGDVFIKKGQKDSALFYYKRALDISKKVNKKLFIARISVNIGKLLIDKGDLKNANIYLLQSENIAKQTGVKEILYETYYNLYKLYALKKHYKTACHYLNLNKIYSDSVFNSNMSADIAEMQAKYESEKKEKQILLLSKQNVLEKANANKQTFLKYLFLSGLLLICISTVLLYRYVRLKNKLNKRLVYDKNFLQTLMDANPNPQYFKDINGKYIGCNKSFESILGMKKEDIIGKKVKELSTIITTEDHEKIDAELLKHQGHEKYSGITTLADKKDHCFEIIKTTYKNEKDGIGGILGILVDITHIKEQEELIRKQEQESLQNKLKQKENELINMTLQLAQNNKAVRNFKENIRTLKKFSNKEGNKLIKSYIVDYNNILEERNWEDFENRFIETHKEFYSVLIQNYPQLTKNDIKICLLIYLKLSTKKISEITIKSPGTIENARIRIRKKLNISGTDEDLGKFLSQL